MTLPPEIPVHYHGGVPRHQANPPAIVSFVLGILGCVPLLAGIGAIVFGIVGIRKSRDPRVGGKNLAIAGIVLGIISLLGWCTFAGFLGYGYQESKPARVVATRFLQEVTSGDINGAMADSGGFPSAKLQSDGQQLKQFGALQQVDLTSFNISKMGNAPTTMHLGGTATFSIGQKSCTFDLVKQGSGYKVVSYWVR